MGKYSMTKQARVYNGEKIAFTVNNIRKTGQLHVKEPTNWYGKLSYHVQK